MRDGAVSGAFLPLSCPVSFPVLAAVALAIGARDGARVEQVSRIGHEAALQSTK